MPHATSRRCIHSGEAADGSKPTMVRMVNRSQPVGSSVPHSCGSAIWQRCGQVGESHARIDERDPVRDGDLARDAADGQRIAAVGRDRDVEHLVAHADDGRGVVAGLPRTGRQDDDPVVVVTEGELALRADHAVGDLAVRGTRRDLEAPGQDGAGQRDDDEVAGREVAGAADDAAHAATSGADVDLAPADRLLELGELLHLEHTTDDEVADDTGADRLDGLDLEARTDEAGSDVAAGLTRGDLDELAEPRQGRAHQASTPNASEKRTSPSTMSRMSLTPLRNISVRSTPMPNAKPR